MEKTSAPMKTKNLKYMSTLRVFRPRQLKGGKMLRENVYCRDNLKKQIRLGDTGKLLKVT